MNVPASAPQSTFVTTLAWTLITFNGFGVFWALMQNVIVIFVFPSMIATDTPTGQALQALPMTFFRVAGVLFLGFAVFMTYAAYALLKRRNWARRTFIVVFAVSIVCNILSAVVFGLGFGLAEFPAWDQAAVPPEFRALFTWIVAVLAILSVGMSVLFAWLIKRLRSPSVKAEFSDAAVVT